MYKYSFNSEFLCVENCGPTYLNYDVDDYNNECISSCPTETYLDSANYYCRPCNFTCATCSGGNDDECETCDPSYPFYTEDTRCVSDCASNEYKDILNGN